MTQYILKSALVGELEKRIKTNKECMLGLRNLDYYQGKVDALNDTISSLNTLEVRDINLEKEQLVEKACDAYCKVCGHYAHKTPTYICRQGCDYYKKFRNYMKGE